jgi:hypothetical protein
MKVCRLGRVGREPLRGAGTKIGGGGGRLPAELEPALDRERRKEEEMDTGVAGELLCVFVYLISMCLKRVSGKERLTRWNANGVRVGVAEEALDNSGVSTP